MITLIIFIIVLGILVFVHEFGHFFAAKKKGVGVEEFGFGFPPRVAGFRKKEEGAGGWEIIWGNKSLKEGASTLYSLNWIPLGGFVRIKGESGEKAEEPDSFAGRKISDRALIVSMGVIANVLLTIVLISLGLAVGMPQVISDKISRFAEISDRRIEVLTVLPNSPAERANIKSADAIIAVSGLQPPSSDWLRDFIQQNINQEIELTLRRQGEIIQTGVIPEVLKETGQPGVGIGMAEVGTVRYPWWLALPKGAQATAFFVKVIFQVIGTMFRDLALGKQVAAELTGPVGIAVLTGEAARLGWVYLLQFVAVLSINLAIINILPFPALDGGRLLFLGIEKLRGRPVSRKVELVIHNLGFTLLLFLIVLVTYRDLSRFSGRFAEWLTKMIQ